jgi:hypothetical protein
LLTLLPASLLATCNLAGFNGQLQRVKEAAGIPAGDLDEVVERSRLEAHLPLAVAVFRVGNGPFSRCAESGGIQRP